MIGWDIGGVNTKVARVANGEVCAVRGRPYELQRDPQGLAPLLLELAAEIGGAGAEAVAAHAVTMTAELSQMFRTKREGVAFVLDAVAAAFPTSVARVFSVDGHFLAPQEARQQPLAVAAANWAATAHAIAVHHPDALLVDIGTTSTDIIPIVGGAVVAAGRTDPERLASGELVYTGALRTPTEAIASHAPLGENMAGVSAEGFALAGDVHLWRGDLAPADYTVPTPDGRPATPEFAGERLARVVCADRELLDEAAVSSIADALAGAQVARITEAITRVVGRHPSLRTAVVTGLGAFLGDRAARSAGLQVVPLAVELGDAAARCAPAACVALLLERELAAGAAGTGFATVAQGFSPAKNRRTQGRAEALPYTQSVAEARHHIRGDETISEHTGQTGTMPIVDIVVKLGGGVLAHPEHFEAALAAIAAAARERPLLIVPGGGPFADTVRAVDQRLHLSEDAAHWMAILAMDQYAYLVAARLSCGVIVTELSEIAAAHGAGQVPVLAPSRWLRDADPLPHAWTVTSDSIAAWVAGAVGARRLVLVKPPRLRRPKDSVTAGFGAALPGVGVSEHGVTAGVGAAAPGLPLPDHGVTAGLGAALPGVAGSELVDGYFARALPAHVTPVIIHADETEAIRRALL